TISTPQVDTTYTATFDGPGATTTTSTSSTIKAPTSTTTSSVAPQTATTSTTTTSSPVQPSTTTTSTVGPRCSVAVTAQAVGGRIDQLADHVSAVAPSLGRSGRDLERRVRRASDRVQRAAAQCAAYRPSRARASLRIALRQLTATAKRIRSRAARNGIPQDVATKLEAMVRSSAGDVKALRNGLACP